MVFAQSTMSGSLLPLSCHVQKTLVLPILLSVQFSKIVSESRGKGIRYKHSINDGSSLYSLHFNSCKSLH